MVLNIRPQSQGVLDTVVEEMEERFQPGQDEEILKIIGDVLGRADSSNTSGVVEVRMEDSNILGKGVLEENRGSDGPTEDDGGQLNQASRE